MGRPRQVPMPSDRWFNATSIRALRKARKRWFEATAGTVVLFEAVKVRACRVTS